MGNVLRLDSSPEFQVPSEMHNVICIDMEAVELLFILLDDDL